MKRFYRGSIWVLIVAIFMALNLEGCATLRKKFIRKKKKEEATAPAYSRIEEYNTAPSLDLYTKHYIYWKSWHKEIMELLGQNSKKDKRCISEMIGNLDDLKSMLVDEKGDELDKHIDKLRAVEKDILNKELTLATKTRIRRTLEKEFMLIKINFNYKKMASFIRKEFRRTAGTE